MSEFHNKLILRLSLESKQNAVILLAGRWSCSLLWNITVNIEQNRNCLVSNLVQDELKYHFYKD